MIALATCTEMKLVFALLALVAFSQAYDDIDWSKVKMRDITLPVPDNAAKAPNTRIVGGHEATAHSLPYQVGMLITMSDGVYFCGGSLISKRFVLTAAHCVDGASQIQVRLGAHRINDNEDSQVRIYTTKYNVHQGWDSTALKNDIATVDLDTEVELGENIQVIGLPTYADAGTSFSGETARLSGWGKDSDSSDSISEVLRYVDAEVITNLVCNLSYLGQIQSTNICTGGAGNIGSCSGDSGGPLVLGNKQIGIVSFGLAIGCEVGWPSALTRVTSYLDWIQDHSDVIIH